MLAIGVNNLGNIVVSSVGFPLEPPWSTYCGEKLVHSRVKDWLVSFTDQAPDPDSLQFIH